MFSSASSAHKSEHGEEICQSATGIFFGSGVKSRIVGAVLQKVKKKSAWTICWGLNWHTRQECSHQGGLGSPSVSSTMLPGTSIISALETPSWALYVTQTDQDGQRLQGVCKQHCSSSARRGQRSPPVRHFATLKVTLLFCALREQKNSNSKMILNKAGK